MEWITLILVLLLSVLSTASCSIGLQCLGKNSDSKSDSNHGYLSFILGVSVLGIIFAIGAGTLKVVEKPPAASVLVKSV